ncbi:MAG TPA: SDR family NAD(P)-dependent oxidoreductase, partial [Pirellulaceae bacterium]
MSSRDQHVILITGGSSGLGKAVAMEFARLGMRVVIAARDVDRLERTAVEIRSQGHDAMAVPTDITDSLQVERLFDQVRSTWGRLDILANVAGKSMRGRLEHVTPEQHFELWNLNFLATVRCTLAALPFLRSSRGSIINVGSLASRIAPPYLGAYPASKFPVAAFSQQLRLELGDEVHVLLVCPGPIARDDSAPRYSESASDLPDAAHRPAGGARL